MPALEMEAARFFCRRDGDGEPILLVHSTGCSSCQWERTSEALAEGYEVIRPDLYGHGASPSWPGHHALTLGDEAALVSAAMRATDRPVHLVGHSYGGAVALKAALDCPWKLATLTLVEPAAFFLLRGRGPAEDRLAAEIEEVALSVVAALVTGAYAEGMEHFVDYWNGAGAWTVLPGDQKAALVSRIHAVALNFSAVSVEPLRLPDLRRIECPTLVLRGERSPATTRRIAETLADAIPHCRMETVLGAGHMLPLTHREFFETALRDHIGRRPGLHRGAAA